MTTFPLSAVTPTELATVLRDALLESDGDRWVVNFVGLMDDGIVTIDGCFDLERVAVKLLERLEMK